MGAHNPEAYLAINTTKRNLSVASFMLVCISLFDIHFEEVGFPFFKIKESIVAPEIIAYIVLVLLCMYWLIKYRIYFAKLNIKGEVWGNLEKELGNPEKNLSNSKKLSFKQSVFIENYSDEDSILSKLESRNLSKLFLLKFKAVLGGRHNDSKQSCFIGQQNNISYWDIKPMLLRYYFIKLYINTPSFWSYEFPNIFAIFALSLFFLKFFCMAALAVMLVFVLCMIDSYLVRIVEE